MSTPTLPGGLPPWLPKTSRSEPPPSRADVVVIGAGVAGLAAAGALAAGGATVAVLEASEVLGAGASGCGMGRVRVGHTGHPSRLAAEVGHGPAVELLRFAAQNTAAWRRLGLLQVCGSVAVALLPDEAAQLGPSVAVLADAGVSATLWPAEQVQNTLGAPTAGPGLWVPTDGRIHPGDALDALAAAAWHAGATVTLGAKVTRVRDGTGHDGLPCQVVQATWRDQPVEVRVDAVVHATGHAGAEVDAWLAEKVFSTRTQYIATPAGQPQRWASPGVGQTGWIAWDQTEDGRLVFAGCRYATLSMGVYEADTRALSAKVEQVQHGVLARTFPDLDPAAFTTRWASIEAHTCDQLPLVGPTPGRAAHVMCIGFNGMDASFALGAGEAVAEGLLTGTATGVPRLMRPDRFV